MWVNCDREKIYYFWLFNMCDVAYVRQILMKFIKFILFLVSIKFILLIKDCWYDSNYSINISKSGNQFSHMKPRIEYLINQLIKTEI
jgi:hypothetical protein